MKSTLTEYNSKAKVGGFVAKAWQHLPHLLLEVTALTKKTVDGFVPHFMERLGGKGRHCKFEFRYDR